MNSVLKFVKRITGLEKGKIELLYHCMYVKLIPTGFISRVSWTSMLSTSTLGIEVHFNPIEAQSVTLGIELKAD